MAVVAAAVVACGVGLAAGRLHKARVLPRLGPSWEDWRDAERIGGPRAGLVGFAVAVLLWLAQAGTFLPDWVRAAIPGALFGYCAPFFVEGVRRWRATRVKRTEHDVRL